MGEAHIRVVFSDMDDTFLTADKRILPENIAAVDAMRERGTLFVPCTGRHLGGIPDEVLARADYAVCDSGASVYDARSGELLWSCPVEKADVLDMCRAARDPHVEFDLYIGGKVYANREDWWITDKADLPEAVREYLSTCRTPYDSTFEEFVASVPRIDRVSVLALTTVDMERVRPALEEHRMFRFTPVLPNVVEATALGASKGAALRALCERLGLSTGEALALGDSPNDISMLEVAGTFVAVGNAIDECKERASLIAPSCDEAGFAWAVEHLGLV